MKAILPVVLLLLGAACSTDDEAGPAPTPTSFLEQGIRYAQCMRANGIPNFPDPETNGDSVRIRAVDKNSVDVATLAAAQDACRQYAPVLSDADGAQKLDAARYESRCMREHGVADFPDPDGTGHAELPQAVRDDPQFEQAKAICRDLVRSYTPSPVATR